MVPEIFKFEKWVKYANELTDDIIHSNQYYIEYINRDVLANLQCKTLKLVEQESIEESDESDLDRLDETDTLLSSSDNLSLHVLPRKPHDLSDTKLETETSSSEDDSAAIQGFRFIDMAVLSPIFRLLLC